MKREKLRLRKGGMVSEGVRNRRHEVLSRSSDQAKQRSARQSLSRGKRTQREVAERCDRGSRRPPAAQPQGRGRNQRMDGN